MCIRDRNFKVSEDWDFWARVSVAGFKSVSYTHLDVYKRQIPLATDSYHDKRSKKLVLREIDIDPELESESLDQRLGFAIDNLVL